MSSHKKNPYLTIFPLRSPLPDKSNAQHVPRPIIRTTTATLTPRGKHAVPIGWRRCAGERPGTPGFTLNLVLNMTINSKRLVCRPCVHEVIKKKSYNFSKPALKCVATSSPSLVPSNGIELLFYNYYYYYIIMIINTQTLLTTYYCYC